MTEEAMTQDELQTIRRRLYALFGQDALSDTARILDNWDDREVRRWFAGSNREPMPPAIAEWLRAMDKTLAQGPLSALVEQDLNMATEWLRRIAALIGLGPATGRQGWQQRLEWRKENKPSRENPKEENPLTELLGPDYR